MRILHVIASIAPRYGGPSKVCLELGRELVRQGAQVSIYTTNIDGEKDLNVPVGEPQWVDGVEIIYFPVQVPRSYKFSLPLAQALKAAIPKYDLVHIHSLYLFPSTVAAFYCRRSGIPYLVRPHGTLDPYIYRRHRARKYLYECLIERRNLNRAAAIHFTSAEEHAQTLPLGLTVPGVVVPLGVDLDDYEGGEDQDKMRLWETYPTTRGKQVILFMGRLNFKKGLDLLTTAFGEIVRARDDVHLLLVGPDNEGYGEKVHRWLEDQGVQEKATFTGMLLGQSKLSVLRGADLFVLPSYAENFGVAVVEAMACEVPVLISNKVNIWREVAEANAGIVVNCDAREVAGGLLTLLADAGARRAMGQRGRRLVAEKFTWNAVGAQMLEIYRRILASHEGSNGALRSA